jgi:hypothetical protein
MSSVYNPTTVYDLICALTKHPPWVQVKLLALDGKVLDIDKVVSGDCPLITIREGVNGLSEEEHLARVGGDRGGSE